MAAMNAGLKVFYVTDHATFWPVGAASVIVARTPAEAYALLDAALAAKGLRGSQEVSYTVQEIDITMAHALILCDGDY